MLYPRQQVRRSSPAQVLAGSNPMPRGIRRLVVLVPNEAIEPAALVAALDTINVGLDPRASEILFVRLSSNPGGDWQAYSQLGELAGRAHHLNLTPRTQLLPSSSWLGVVRQVVQPGDLVVCHVDQAPGRWPWQRGRLAPLLAAKVDVPVYILSGLYESSQRCANWLVRLAYEGALLVIVGGFSWLELQADMTMVNPAKALVLILLFWSELGLIFAWNLLRNLNL
jgi:hypothetical protein